MSDEMRYTERDRVGAWRAGFIRGMGEALRAVVDLHPGAGALLDALPWAEMAAREYPYPKVTRPRVVAEDYDLSWRYVDGGFELNTGDGIWRPGPYITVTPHRVRLWADLLANPTEEVEP
jgi:hypothetical protein